MCGVLTGDSKLLCDGVFASKTEAEVGGRWGGVWRGGRKILQQNGSQNIDSHIACLINEHVVRYGIACANCIVL